jgi:hypothetical protein
MSITDLIAVMSEGRTGVGVTTVAGRFHLMVFEIFVTHLLTVVTSEARDLLSVDLQCSSRFKKKA